MQHPNSLELKLSALLIIDMQDAFRDKIKDFEETLSRIVIATRGAALLNLPVLVTEQYPKGLAHTAAEIAAVFPPSTRLVEKTTFSSCGDSVFKAQLDSLEIKHVLVTGIEAHICVNQTVHDLLASGYKVHLLRDCITSRNPADKETAFRKMELSGAIPSSTEMALFELMRDAKHEQFKAIQGLIK